MGHDTRKEARVAQWGTVDNHEKGYFRHSQDETLTRIIIRHWVRSQSLLMVFNSGKSEMENSSKCMTHAA